MPEPTGSQIAFEEDRLFDVLSNAMQHWLESQGYNAMESDEIVQQLRAEARFYVNTEDS